MDPQNPKITELEKNKTYIICPDSGCNLFTMPDSWCACDWECPKEDELVKIVLCSCGQQVQIPRNQRPYQTVHHQCSNGNRATIFRKDDYIRIFKKPE